MGLGHLAVPAFRLIAAGISRHGPARDARLQGTSQQTQFNSALTEPAKDPLVRKDPWCALGLRLLPKHLHASHSTRVTADWLAHDTYASPIHVLALRIPQPRDQPQCILPVDRSEIIALEER